MKYLENGCYILILVVITIFMLRLFKEVMGNPFRNYTDDELIEIYQLEGNNSFRKSVAEELRRRGY